MNSKMTELINRIYVFKYKAIENDEFSTIYEDGVPMNLNEEELKAIAENWKHEELELPESLQERINAAIMKQMEEQLEEEGYDLNEITLLIDKRPFELELAIKQIMGEADETLDSAFDPFHYEFEGKFLNVDIHYTTVHEGTTLEETCPYSLRLDIANIMFDVLDTKPNNISDFDYMKHVAPKAYDYVYQDVRNWCNNSHLAKWGKCVDVTLKDFPKEVYSERYNY